MGKWQKVKRCKECGKIYSDTVPEICVKCGARLGTVSTFMALFGQRQVLRGNRCESVIAKRTVFGWKVREENDTQFEKKGKVEVKPKKQKKLPEYIRINLAQGEMVMQGILDGINGKPPDKRFMDNGVCHGQEQQTDKLHE